MEEQQSKSNEYLKKVFADIQEGYLATEKNLDRKTFGLSSCAIGFSLTLLQFIGKPILASWLMTVAITCFAVVIALCLIIQLIGLFFQRKQLYTIRHSPPNKSTDTEKTVYDKMLMQESILWFLNVCNAAILVAGLVFLCMFALNNIHY